MLFVFFLQRVHEHHERESHFLSKPNISGFYFFDTQLFANCVSKMSHHQSRFGIRLCLNVFIPRSWSAEMFKDHRTSGGCWGGGGIELEGSPEQRGAARGSTTKAAQNKQLSIVWKLHRKNKYVSKITYFPS